MIQTRLTFGRNLSTAPPPLPQGYLAIFSSFHLKIWTRFLTLSSHILSGRLEVGPEV